MYWILLEIRSWEKNMMLAFLCPEGKKGGPHLAIGKNPSSIQVNPNFEDFSVYPSLMPLN